MYLKNGASAKCYNKFEKSEMKECKKETSNSEFISYINLYCFHKNKN